MTYRINITGPAKRDIRANVEWWSENRSAEEADRWYVGIHGAMRSLCDTPERHPFADEPEFAGQQVRQMNFGLGNRPSHRIVFEVVDKEVVIYRIRSGWQDALRVGDLHND